MGTHPLPQQLPHLHPHRLGQSFQALEGEVAFASFQAAHVGAVDAELVGEGFLGEAFGKAVGPEVAPYGALEIADGHGVERCRTLLEGLQTYE